MELFWAALMVCIAIAFSCPHTNNIEKELAEIKTQLRRIADALQNRNKL